jgi:ectoine hydroxylase-related dioxygenase (phytanoyl-CoA dioxygenase family)
MKLGRILARDQAREPGALTATPPSNGVARQTPEQQAAYFRTFGALVVPGLFTAEIDGIRAAFDDVFAREPVGAHDAEDPLSLHRVMSPDHGPARRQIPSPAEIRAGGVTGFIERSEKLNWLQHDARLTDLARALLGDDFFYVGSVGNVFNSYIYWHSDYFRSAVPGETRLKMSFYLEDLDGSSGALRVIPGTNHLGTYRDLLYDENRAVDPDHLEKLFGMPEDQLPHLALASKPGDVVVFNNMTLHANFHGRPNRRMFSVQFAQPRRAS